MTENSMAISLSQNSFSSVSDCESSSNIRIGSSSQHCPPPATKNQPLVTQHAKKPRNRRLGSRNKPKSSSLPMVQPTSLPVAQPTEPSAKFVMVNVAPGRDVIKTILDVARENHVSLVVLSASGMINSVTLHNSPYGGPAPMLHGPFTLISLTGSYLHNNHHIAHLGATIPPPLCFGINLSTSYGQVFGGPIGGPVIAGDDVSLMVSTFRNPEIYMYIP